MAKKLNKKNNINIWILSVIIFIVVILVLINIRMQKNNIDKTTIQSSDYVQSLNSTPSSNYFFFRSKSLKFTVQIPSKFRVEEFTTSINIKNSKGTIQIDKYSTNHNNLEKHINGLSKLNNVEIKDRQQIIINNLESIKAAYSSSPIALIYFFYPEPWTIITISTDFPELYSDLDRIARSFRYEP